MEVTISIPKYLERYLEYIPSESLPIVISDLVSQSIRAKCIINKTAGVSSYDSIEDILNKIKCSGTQDTVGAAVQSVDSSAVQDEIESKDEVMSIRDRLNAISDDDDLDDIMGLLK